MLWELQLGWTCFSIYNRGSHTWETSPLASGQPFSSVECVNRCKNLALPTPTPGWAAQLLGLSICHWVPDEGSVMEWRGIGLYIAGSELIWPSLKLSL